MARVTLLLAQNIDGFQTVPIAQFHLQCLGRHMVEFQALSKGATYWDHIARLITSSYLSDKLTMVRYKHKKSFFFIYLLIIII